MKTKLHRWTGLLVLSLCTACEPPPQYHFQGCPIINGVRDESPEHMAVVYLQMVVDGQGQACTGTLIGARVVLTAAHCVYQTQPENVTVFFGTNAMSSQLRGVEALLWHPRYNSRSVENDIAMVRLSASAPLGVVPIPHLPKNLGITAGDIGTPLEFVGFGVTETGSSGIKLSVWNNLDWICTSAGGCNLGGGAWAVRNTICQDQNPGGPCSGDSGGPALITRADREYVCGITSYGDAPSCTHFGCSTKVDEFEDFIREFAGNAAGEACSGDLQCISGHCVGGVCCQQACSGRCETCSLPGHLGQCLPVANGTPCPDSDVCNGQETCLDGVCRRGTPLVCRDEVDCTQDSCDPVSGCLFRPQAAACDDGNICTRDFCDPQQGCYHEPMPDGLECAKGKHCQAGSCVKKPSNSGGCASTGAGPLPPVLLLLFLPLALLARALRGRSRPLGRRTRSG